MNHRKKISYRIIGLLLIYLTGSLPLAIFHRHDFKIVSLEKANNCEKVIYYPGFNHLCKHETHVDTFHEKCSLCVHHIVPVHAAQANECFVLNSLREFCFISRPKLYWKNNPVFKPVRGPPVASYYTA